METREALVLRHTPTGLYYGKMKDHTKDLWSAMRFMNEEQLQIWFEVSPHVPKNRNDYEPETVVMTIERSGRNVQEK